MTLFYTKSDVVEFIFFYFHVWLKKKKIRVYGEYEINKDLKLQLKRQNFKLILFKKGCHNAYSEIVLNTSQKSGPMTAKNGQTFGEKFHAVIF